MKENEITKKTKQETGSMLLNAFSYLYRKSHNLRLVDMFFVYISALFPLIVFFGLKDGYKGYAVYFGLFWLTLDFIFDRFYKENRKKAVNIHEQFDCYVYQLPWNKEVAGEKVSELEIIKYNKKNKQSTVYSEEIDKTKSKNTSVMLAMRENLYFETQNRKLFKNAVVIIFSVYYALLFSFAVFQELASNIFILAYLVPTFSFSKYYFKMYSKNQKLLTNQIRIYNKIELLLLEYEENKIGFETNVLREIQDAIFEYRNENAEIPSLIYNLQKNKLNNYINIANKRYIERTLNTEHANKN